MKKTPILIASHLLLGSAVFFIAKTNYQIDQKNHSAQENGKSVSQRPSSPENVGSFPNSKRPQTRAGKGGINHSPAAFRAAWAALPDQKLKTKDRIAAQRKLLAEWAKVDLEGAMEAAISEGWNDSAAGISLGNTYRQGPYASALKGAFLENPEQSWAIIQSDRLGLGRSMLRHAWLEAMAQKPLVLASKLGEISWRERGEVISSLRYNRLHDVTQEQLFQELSRYPEDVIETADLLQFIPTPSPEDARNALAGVTDFESRGGKLSLLSYGKALNQSFLSSESNFQENFAQVIGQIEELPHAAQGALLYGLYTDFDEDSYRGGRSEKTLALLDELIAGEHWDLVNRREVVRQFKYGTSDLSLEERAAWVTELPERRETFEIFYRGIEGYVGANMDLAWEWIQEFPADHWRDQALAVYSQEALNRHEDYEASQRALNAIQNPNVRRAAESWRPEWAKQRDRE